MVTEKEIFQNIYSYLHKHGRISSPRGMKTLEIENYSFELPPYTRFANFAPRKLSIDYIKKEFLWYLGGDPYDLSIGNYATIWKSIVHNEKLNSNYGYYVFTKKGFDWVVECLTEDKNSRRAYIPILERSLLNSGEKDIPCTCYIGFRMRNNKLNMTVRMRSQDAIYGFCNDIVMFSFFHEMVHLVLRKTYADLELGVYHHSSDSFHIYERHFEMLEKLIHPEVEFTPVVVPKLLDSGEVQYLIDSKGKFSVAPEEYQFTKWLVSL